MSNLTDEKLFDNLQKIDEQIEEIKGIIKAADPDWTDSVAVAGVFGGVKGILDRNLSPGARFLSALLAAGSFVGEILLISDRGKRAEEAKSKLKELRETRAAIVVELENRGYTNVT
jgi:hypothetical protein